MRTDIKRLFIWMTVFFIAMAFLESAVVVYLRALYYPGGFEFPLVPMDPALVYTEVFRELATMVMLLVPGALVARSALERFAWFCFGFGVWDIFYYVWLKVLLDWPSGLADPDLLFLLPIPWVGPVWAPCVISLGLIALALVILRGRSNGVVRLVDTRAWMLLVTGACILVFSFTMEALLSGDGLDALVLNPALAEPVAPQEPGMQPLTMTFPWPWFAGGSLVAFGGLVRVFHLGRRVP